MRTHFQDFTRDNGLPITVEYSVEGSYVAPSYSPHSGADGGDAPEIFIINSWSRTEEYDRLCERRLSLEFSIYGKPGDPLLMTPEKREELAEFDAEKEKLEATAELTDAERERMESWLYEHYEPDEPDIEF